MVKIIINLPEDLDFNIKMYMLENNITNKNNAIVKKLKEVFGNGKV